MYGEDPILDVFMGRDLDELHFAEIAEARKCDSSWRSVFSQDWIIINVATGDVVYDLDPIIETWGANKGEFSFNVINHDYQIMVLCGDDARLAFDILRIYKDDGYCDMCVSTNERPCV